MVRKGKFDSLILFLSIFMVVVSIVIVSIVEVIFVITHLIKMSMVATNNKYPSIEEDIGNS